jgi:putative protease
MDGKKQEYPLSLKDICTLRLIPDLIEAGIYSFKIEGRMKSPVYVGSVVAMYRKYIDQYLNSGREGFHVADEDIEHLMDVYNRGAFTEGYYNNRCGKEMVSLQRPNHAGIPALKVLSSQSAVALHELHRGDTIEIPAKNISFSLNQDAKPGDKIGLSSKYRISPKEIPFLSRTFNKKIADYYDSELKNRKIKEKIKGTFTLSVGNHAKLCIDYADLHLEVEGDVVQQAVKSPLSEEQIRKQLSKMGQTEFVWESLDIRLDGDVFLPLQSLNEIRRRAIEDLTRMILESSRRQNAKRMIYPEREEQKSELFYTALIMKKEQLNPVLKCEEISDVYVDCNIIPDSLESLQLAEIADRIHETGKAAFYVLPHIIRKDTAERIRRGLPHIVSCGFDGIMVRNMEGYEILRENDYAGLILADHSLYTFNRLSRDNWKAEGIYRLTVPLELNEKEIDIRGLAGDEMIGYGYLPMMVSAQCIQKTGYGCTRKRTEHTLTDRKNEQFAVHNYCDYCYNVIYNSKPLFLLDKQQVLFSKEAGAVRLQFTLESADQTEEVLRNFRENLKGNTTEEFSGTFTRGHFSRGVK